MLAVTEVSQRKTVEKARVGKDLPRLADGVDWLSVHPSTNHNDSQRFTSLSCIESRYLHIPRQVSVRSKIVGMTCSCSYSAGK